jgi:hypothetical protein
MTITVEDGTVIAGANSYVDVATADAFFEDYGLTLWTTTAGDEAKEAALVKGAIYLRQRYRLRWKGSLADATQTMDWPRRGVDVPDFFDPFFRNVHVPLAFIDTYFIPENEIPEEVKQAQMFLAFSTLDSTGASSITLQPSFGRMTKREKLGDLEVEYMTGLDGGNTKMTTTYWDAEQIIKPYLKPYKPHTGTLVRS